MPIAYPHMWQVHLCIGNPISQTEISLNYEVVFNLGEHRVESQVCRVCRSSPFGVQLDFTRGHSEMTGLLANRLSLSEFIYGK